MRDRMMQANVERRRDNTEETLRRMEAVKEKELETGKEEKSRKLEESSQVMMISYSQPMRNLGIILSPRLWRRFQMKQSQLFQGQLSCFFVIVNHY